ncbi:MAG: homoserine kinase [Candidatus Puniceispirillaceae bacterium]
MAVYTSIEDHEIAGLLAKYDIGQLLSLAGIAEGVENSNFLLRTDRGSFILTLYEKRTNEADLPFFMALKQHLSKAGINCPLPIADKTGAILQKVAGRPAAIFSFLDGVSYRSPTASHCHSLGVVLAQMHHKTADFEGQRPNALGPDAWPDLLASIDHDPADLPAGLREDTKMILDDVVASWPKNLPKGVIHADLFPNNVMFVGDDLTGVIDFYFACSDILAYDLCICLNSWCFEADGSLNITKSAAMIKGYQSVRTLSQQEISALPVLCRGAAIRFFLTRLYDWIHTPKEAFVKPHDPMEYWSKIRFHQRVTSANAYGLW